MNHYLAIKGLEGFFDCKSHFGRHFLTCDNFSAEFPPGINILYCDIDFGGWAVSYVLSDMPTKKQFFELFDIKFNGENVSLKELKKRSVYIDGTNKYFNKKITVRKQIERNIKKHKLDLTSEDVRKLFEIDSERYDREYTCVGNEIWRCLSAMAYTDMKSVFLLSLDKRKDGKLLRFKFEILL